MLEAWWLKRVLDHLRHFDDSLLQAIGIALLAWSITDEGRLALTVWNILRLGRLDLPVDKLLQRCPSLVRRRLHFVLRWTLQIPLVVIQILAMRNWNEVLELRLDEFAGTLALERNGVVSNIAVGVDLERERVACSGLHRRSIVRVTE